MASSWSDPQFYVVTAAALGALWMVVRPFLRRSKDQQAGCPTCTTCSVTRDRGGSSSGSSPSLVNLGSGRS